MTEQVPFISEDDVRMVGSSRPFDIGQHKLSDFHFNMDQTVEEMQAMCEKAIEVKKKYEAWQAFYDDLELRKRRQLGFQAVVGALDITATAEAMGTTPERLLAVMQGNAAAEANRIKELQALWKRGELPDRPVLTDPSKEVLQKETGPTSP